MSQVFSSSSFEDIRWYATELMTLMEEKHVEQSEPIQCFCCDDFIQVYKHKLGTSGHPYCGGFRRDEFVIKDAVTFKGQGGFGSPCFDNENLAIIICDRCLEKGKDRLRKWDNRAKLHHQVIPKNLLHPRKPT